MQKSKPTTELPRHYRMRKREYQEFDQAFEHYTNGLGIKNKKLRTKMRNDLLRTVKLYRYNSSLEFKASGQEYELGRLAGDMLVHCPEAE